MIKDYLKTLHMRPDHHKQRFSLLIAGSFTLLIFSVWYTVHYGSRTVIAEAPIEEIENEAQPLDTFRASAIESWNLMTAQFEKAKQGLESVNLEDSYTQVRNEALNNQYGQ